MKLNHSNLSKLVYTCLCASHSKASLITGTRAHNVHKNHIMISKGRSLIGRAGVLNSWPFPLVPKFPSRGNFDDDGHVAFGTSHGFPRFPRNKIFRWQLYIWQSSPILTFLIQKSIFQKICRIWNLWCLSISHCTCEIRFKTVGVRTVGLLFEFPKGGMKKPS